MPWIGRENRRRYQPIARPTKPSSWTLSWSSIALVAMHVSSSLIIPIKLSTRKESTQSEPIGGHFPLQWAKLINGDCSIMIALGLLAPWYIVKLVRLCAISQGTIGDRPVNLKALTELASTD
ncbi:hypothetical protein CEP53_011840 [Fusarium sp. AF-6]|nr:hypothetical protein CEP53_011840 [Fusarium sp. AF-6]